ncbi:MAG: SDR family oxidoreductase [Deltaproteobacteria bacterium]|nr:SDR family oxidoreductase [Deltaproteobacteria bacterium]
MKEIRTVLIVGGAGYLGSILSRACMDEGFEVTVYDLLQFGNAGLKTLETQPNFSFIQGDARDFAHLTSTIVGKDAVIMLAAVVGAPPCEQYSKDAVDINYLITNAVADCCVYYGVPRFIFASSDSVYGLKDAPVNEQDETNPISLYGVLKRKVEKEVGKKSSNMFCPTFLRMATLFGLSPRMRFDLIVNSLAMRAAVHGKVTAFNGAQFRPLVHVKDAAQAYIKVLRSPDELVRNKIYNVGDTGQNLRMYEIAELVKKTIPGVELQYTSETKDYRSYFIECEKIKEIGYQVQYDVGYGIKEMYDAVKSGSYGDCSDEIYYNYHL